MLGDLHLEIVGREWRVERGVEIADSLSAIESRSAKATHTAHRSPSLDWHLQKLVLVSFLSFG